MTNFKSGIKARGSVFPEQAIKKANDENRSIANISFPGDIGAHQFVMNFVKYRLTSDRAVEDIQESIALPLPGTGITDKAGIKYNESELGLLGGAAIGGAGGIQKAVDTLKEGGEVGMPSGLAAAKTFFEAGGAGARSLLKQVDGLGGAADLAFGNTINPHVVLLFQNIQLKTFNFTWKLSPRNQAESKVLKKLINRLQAHSHPEQKSDGNTSNFFLNYPDQVDLFYLGVNDNLHYFKRAAITSLEVNYQTEGTILFAGTGAPGAVELTLGFQETEIWTKEDYDSVGEE
jgi:hypothetical protein